MTTSEIVKLEALVYKEDNTYKSIIEIADPITVDGLLALFRDISFRLYMAVKDSDKRKAIFILLLLEIQKSFNFMERISAKKN